MSRYKTREIDLATARTAPGDFFTINTTRKYLMVASAPGTAYLHVGTEDSDRVGPLERGDSDCAPEGSTGSYTWAIENPAGSGTLVLVLTDDPSLCLADVGGGGGGGIPSISPQRLTGNLAAGTTIADGSEASEDVDVAGAGSIRVRAQATGIATTTEEANASDTVFNVGDRIRSAYMDPRGYAFAVGDDGIIGAWDVSDPASPSFLGSLNSANFARFDKVAVDPKQHKAVVIGDNGGTKLVGVFDVSDPSSITEDGNVDTGISTGGAGADDQLTVALNVGASVAYCGIYTDGNIDHNLVAVDYSTASAPSVGWEGQRLGAGAAVSQDEQRMVSLRASTDTFILWDISDPLNPKQVQTGTVRIDGSAVDVVNGSRMAIDRDRGLFCGINSTGGPGDGFWIASLDTMQGLGFHAVSAGSESWLDLDREAGQAHIYGGGNLDVVAYGGRADDPSWHTSVAMDGSTDDGDWNPALGIGVVSDRGSTRVELYTHDPGRDVLRVREKLANGNRATEGGADMRLYNGVTAMLDVDVLGPDKAAVEVQARSGVQSTVEFVEVAQEVE